MLRDLSWLFNATRPEPERNRCARRSSSSGTAHEHARRLGAELRHAGFAGVTCRRWTRRHGRGVKQAIRDFEPRIDAQTLEVEVGIDAAESTQPLQLLIRGKLWAQPVPLELLLRGRRRPRDRRHARLRDAALSG